jgi:Domain of unknown function (DUF1772)
MVITSTALFAFLAYRERAATGLTFPLYAAATLLTLGHIPFTLTVMAKTNASLEEKAKSATKSSVGDAVADVKGEDDTHTLMGRWSAMNAVRGYMTTVAGVLALWAILESTQV